MYDNGIEQINHFQQYFSCIVTVSFIGGRNRSTRSKPHIPVANSYRIMLYRVDITWVGFELLTLVVLGTDCIGSYKSNYHMTTTAPNK